MPLAKIFISISLILYPIIFLNAESRDEILRKGKELYNGAGSCVACHMPDGKGQKGTIPPLAGSDWLKGGSARSIAISLRGLAGPIKGKR